MKVKATNAYQELKIQAKELNKIPEVGEEFEIENEKFTFLNGNNKYKKVFVEKVEEKKEEKTETAEEVDGKEEVEAVLKTGKKKK